MVSCACEGISLGRGTPFGTGGDVLGSGDVSMPDKLVEKSSKTTYVLGYDRRSVGFLSQGH